MDFALSSSVAPSVQPLNSSTGFLGSVGMLSTGSRPSLPSPKPGRTSSVGEPWPCHVPFRRRSPTSSILWKSFPLPEPLQTPSTAWWACRPLGFLSRRRGFRQERLLSSYDLTLVCATPLPRPVSRLGSSEAYHAQSSPGLALRLPPPGLPASSTQVLPSPAPSTSGTASSKAATAAPAALPDVQALMDEWQETFITRMQDMFGATLPQQWIPLLHGIWAPTRCGSWVPLMIERHHGPNVRPVQNEPTDAPALGALQVMRQGQVEMDGLSRNSVETPVPHRPLHAVPLSPVSAPRQA